MTSNVKVVSLDHRRHRQANGDGNVPAELLVPLNPLNSSDPSQSNGTSTHIMTTPAQTELPPNSDEDETNESKKRKRKTRCSLLRFPSSVFFIIGNEFCERFSFYGMRAVLTLYFLMEHGYSRSNATLVFHAFVSVAYFSPLFGSILADNFFGRYPVILWVSVVYVCGHGLLTIGAVPGLTYTLRNLLEFGGLFTIALATGGIKPCVSAFGADQFPAEMKKEREQFFSFFYFAVNAGSLLAIIITPLLRGRVKCLGADTCFPLAFGVPAILMLTALMIFLSGTRLYKRLPARGNVIWRVCKCIGFGLKQRIKLGKSPEGGHWLDYAYPKYERSLIEAVKSMLNVFTLCIPSIFFWALFDQQGSTWVLQATRMNVRVGNLNALPDQVNVLNPLFIMSLIAIFESFVYPLVRRLGVEPTALRRMCVGGFITALSFVVAGLVQLEVNKTLVVIPPDPNVSLTVFNTVPNAFTLTNGASRLSLPPSLKQNPVQSYESVASGVWTLRSTDPKLRCPNLNLNIDLPIRYTSYQKHGYVLGLFPNGSCVTPKLIDYEMEKTNNGKTRIYLLSDPSIDEPALKVFIFSASESQELRTVRPLTDTKMQFVDIEPRIIDSDKFRVVVGRNCQEDGANCHVAQEQMTAVSGAAFVMVSWIANRSLTEHMHEIISANSVSILLQVPQFLLMTIGEVLFSVSGLEFSYSQAAPSMRSVLQAVWLLTISCGNWIDMGISGSHIIPEPATEFFVYAGLMATVMLLFVYLAYKYTVADPEKWTDIEKEPINPPPPIHDDDTVEKAISAETTIS